MRFAVILAPFTVLVVLLSVFAIFMIRFLLADLPERSEEVKWISNLDRLIQEVQGVDRALRQYGQAETARLADFLEVQLPDLEHTSRMLDGDQIFVRYPDLHTTFKMFRREIEDFVTAPNVSQAMLSSLRDHIGELTDIAENARDGHQASVYERIDAAQFTGSIAIWALAIGMGTGLLLTGTLAWRLSTRAWRPIEAFIQTAQRIGAGELDAEVVYQRKDEFQHLAAAFGDMASHLRLFHQQLSDEAQAERDRMSALLKHLPFPVFFFDQEPILIVANQAGEQLLDAPEIARRLPDELIEIVNQVGASGNDYAPDKLDSAIFVHAHNNELAFLPKAFALTPPAAAQGIALVLLDVTKLRLASDLRSDLVSIVSHELRTPLTSTQLALHVLLENGDPLTEVQKEMIEMVKGEIARYIRTIENLLDLSLLAKGARTLNRSQITVSELFEGLKNDWSGYAELHGNYLEFSSKPTLPSLSADAGRLRLSIGCLLSNAIRQSPADSHIAVDARQDDKYFEIAVHDKGNGIAEQYQEQIFERFFRLPDDDSPGEGVGLSVAREFVQAHGGDILCQSREGDGSTFTIRLPRDLAPSEERK